MKETMVIEMPFVGVKKTLGNGILQHQDEDQVWLKRNQGSSRSRRFPRQPDIDIEAGLKIVMTVMVF